MPREAPVTSAMREARGLVIGRGSLHGRPCERRNPYAVKVMMADGVCRYGVRKNEGRWLWVPAPERNCALGRDDKSARFRQQRQLPGLRLDLGLVRQMGRIGAGKTVIRELWIGGIAARLAHGAIHAVD